MINIVRRVQQKRLVRIRLKLGAPEVLLLFEVQAMHFFSVVIFEAFHLIKQCQIAHLQKEALLAIVNL